MEGSATEKVPGGKLVRMKIDYDEKINSAKITGDFFLHPEESISEIENSLLGISKNETEENISKKVFELVQEKNLQLIGIDPAAIARVTKAAMK